MSYDPAKGWLFKISGDQVLDVAPNSVPQGVQRTAESGAPLTLRGRLYRKPAGKQKQKKIGPLRFEIMEVLQKS